MLRCAGYARDCQMACVSAPLTNSRANRRPSSFSLWQLPAAKTCRAIWRSCSPAIVSTSRSRARSASPFSSARHGFSKRAAGRLRRWSWLTRCAGWLNMRRAALRDQGFKAKRAKEFLMWSESSSYYARTKALLASFTSSCSVTAAAFGSAEVR